MDFSNADGAFVDLVVSRLAYDPETGFFFWRNSGIGGVTAGQRAGATNNRGYRVVRIAGKQFLEHRLAWLVFYGCWPSGVIDHIDGVKTNNRISNLRDVSQQQNIWNTNLPDRGYDILPSGAFRARIKLNYKHINIGTYSSEEQARAAYLRSSRSYFGDFSPLNRRVD